MNHRQLLPQTTKNPSANMMPGPDIFSQFMEKQIRHVRAYEQPNADGGSLLQFYLNGPIIGSEYYTDMIQAIRMCAPNDKVFIYINSEGGEVDTGLQIINSINECNCEVITVLDSKAYSIAAVIFLAGHTRIVHAQGSLMIHNYSAGLYGKGHELSQQLIGYNLYILNLFKEHLYPFMTNEEIEHVVNGRDYWLSSSDVQERLDAIEQAEQRDKIIADIEALTDAQEEFAAQIAMLREALAEIDALDEEDEPEPKPKRAPRKKPDPESVTADEKEPEKKPRTKRVPPTV